MQQLKRAGVYCAILLLLLLLCSTLLQLFL
jgi:hypothetical protein